VLKVRFDRAEKTDMSDLSRLLDDVYRTSPATPAPAQPQAWSTETKALDEVFSNWIPGPAPATTTEADVEVVPDPEPTVELRAAYRPHRSGVVWSVADDDILPPKRARRLLPFRR
jgi:hypothetical protein